MDTTTVLKEKLIASIYNSLQYHFKWEAGDIDDDWVNGNIDDDEFAKEMEEYAEKEYTYSKEFITAYSELKTFDGASVVYFKFSPFGPQKYSPVEIDEEYADVKIQDYKTYKKLFDSLPNSLQDYDMLKDIHYNAFNEKFVDSKLLEDKDFIIHAAKIDGSIFNIAPEEFKNNKEVILNVVKETPDALHYASGKLKNDKDVVLEAVNNSLGLALKYASDELKNDKDIVLTAVQKDGHALYYASDELKNDKDFILAAVKLNSYALECASDELKNNKDFIIIAVKENSYTLEYTSDELKNDKEVVLAAVQNDGNALQFASDELKNDKEVVLAAVQNDGYTLEYASDELKNDKEVVLEAVKKNDSSLKYAPSEIQAEVEKYGLENWINGETKRQESSLPPMGNLDNLLKAASKPKEAKDIQNLDKQESKDNTQNKDIPDDIR